PGLDLQQRKGSEPSTPPIGSIFGRRLVAEQAKSCDPRSGPSANVMRTVVGSVMHTVCTDSHGSRYPISAPRPRRSLRRAHISRCVARFTLELERTIEDRNVEKL